MNIKYNNMDNVSSKNGIEDTNLEYINVKTNNNPIQPIAKIADKWIRLDEEPKWKKQYPAKTTCLNWGTDGIYKDINNTDNNNISTPGVRWSKAHEPLQPKYWINNYAKDGNNCGSNAWLFDNVSDVNGTFIGGSKR
jgi:hypothetical protein